MYTKIYNNNNELTSIQLDNKIIPIDDNNSDYKRYLVDVDNGVTVVDNKYSDEDILAQKKEAAKKLASKKIGDKILKGFDYNGKKYKCRPLDHQNYVALLECSKDDYFTSRNITEVKLSLIDETKEVVPISTIKDIAYACMDHVFPLRMEGQLLDQQIDDCLNIDELNLLIETESL